jgi:hypothetical protein
MLKLAKVSLAHPPATIIGSPRVDGIALIIAVYSDPSVMAEFCQNVLDADLTNEPDLNCCDITPLNVGLSIVRKS